MRTSVASFFFISLSLAALACGASPSTGSGASGDTKAVAPEDEGPCFAPGEACGTTLCSQSGYCADPDAGASGCVARRVEGSECTQARECIGDVCTGGKCVGNALACTKK